MGLIVDSSVIIALERAGYAAQQSIAKIIEVSGNQPSALSSLGLHELVHGVRRAGQPTVRSLREGYLTELLVAFDVLPFTRATALLSGKLDAEARTAGKTIPFSDLLIGAAALEIGYSILTLNLRHFNLIPGLSVIPFRPDLP